MQAFSECQIVVSNDKSASSQQTSDITRKYAKLNCFAETNTPPYFSRMSMKTRWKVLLNGVHGQFGGYCDGWEKKSEIGWLENFIFLSNFYNLIENNL